jgi:hypothetical protein
LIVRQRMAARSERVVVPVRLQGLHGHAAGSVRPPPAAQHRDDPTTVDRSAGFYDDVSVRTDDGLKIASRTAVVVIHERLSNSRAPGKPELPVRTTADLAAPTARPTTSGMSPTSSRPTPHRAS